MFTEGTHVFTEGTHVFTERDSTTKISQISPCRSLPQVNLSHVVSMFAVCETVQSVTMYLSPWCLSVSRARTLPHGTPTCSQFRDSGEIPILIHC